MAITAGRRLIIHYTPTEGPFAGISSHRTDVASSPLTQVRWQPTGPAADMLAMVEAGGASAGAVVVSKWDEERGPLDARQQERYALQSDVWAVEWDPSQGGRLLVGVNRGEPLRVLDLLAGRWCIPHHGHGLHSDCFAPCWLAPDSALLGLRNGEVRLTDFRAPAASVSLPLVAEMGNVVDQVAALRDGRGVVVSDRLGALRLVDLRAPGTVHWGRPSGFVITT